MPAEKTGGEGSTTVKRIINRIWSAWQTFRELVKNPDSQTYYPNVERKSKRQIMIEIFCGF